MTDNKDKTIFVFIVVVICLFVLIGIIIDIAHRVTDYKRDMMVLKRDWKECQDDEERQYIKEEMKRLKIAYLPFVGKWFV